MSVYIYVIVSYQIALNAKKKKKEKKNEEQTKFQFCPCFRHKLHFFSFLSTSEPTVFSLDFPVELPAGLV